MVIKVFVSGISASKEIKKRQQRALIILDSCKVNYESIDITEPGMEKVREFMQQNSKVRAPNKNPVAPQFFNDEEYCGDYEDFDSAVEVNQVLQFLKLEAPTKEEVDEVKTTTNGVLEEDNRKEEGSPSEEKEEVENEGEDLTNKVEGEDLEDDFWGGQDDITKKRKKEQEGDSELVEESPAAEVEEENWSGQSEGHKRLKVEDDEDEDEQVEEEAAEEAEEEKDFWGEDTNVDKKDEEEEEDEEEESD